MAWTYSFQWRRVFTVSFSQSEPRIIHGGYVFLLGQDKMRTSYHMYQLTNDLDL